MAESALAAATPDTNNHGQTDTSVSVTDQIAKLSASLEKAEREKKDLELQNQQLDKELKKVNDLLSKAKDKQLVQQALDENKKMKQELEFLSEQKMQNAMLKEHMHQIASQCDTQKVQLVKLSKELQMYHEKYPETPRQGIEVKPDDIIHSLEATIKEVREENVKLEQSLAKAIEEINDLKQKKPQEQPVNGATATTSATNPAAALARSWWSRPATTTTTAPAANTTTLHPQQVNAETTKSGEGDHSASHQTPSALPTSVSSTSLNLDAKQATTATPSSSTATAAAPGKPAASTASSWWARTTAAAMTTTSSAPASFAQSTPATASGSDATKLEEQLKAAQSEVESLKSELQHLKEGSKAPSDSNNNVAAIEKELVAAKVEVKLLKEKITALQNVEQESANLKREIDELKGRVQTQLSELSHIREESELGKQQLKDVQLKLAEELATKKKIEDQISVDLQKFSAIESKLNADINAHESRINELQSKISESERQITVLSSREKEAEAKFAEEKRLLSDQIREKTLRIEAMEKLSSGETSSDALAQELANAKSQLESLLAKFEQEKSSLQSSLTETSNELAKVEAENKQLHVTRADDDVKIKELTSELDRLRAAELALACKVTELESQKSAAREGETVVLREDNARLNEQVAKVSTDLSALRQTLADEQAKFQKEQNEIAKLQESEKHCASLKEQIKVLESRVEEARKQSSAGAADMLKKLEDEKHAMETRLKAGLEAKSEEDQRKLKAQLEQSHQKDKHELEERLRKERTDAEERLKKEKSEAEERLKKEKVQLEERLSKEKRELDEKAKSEKQKLQADLDKIKADLEKQKKDSSLSESQKSDQVKKLEKDLAAKNEELNKQAAKVKSVELEVSQLKLDVAKQSEDFKSQVQEAEKQLAKLKEELTGKEASIQSLKDKLAALQSKHDLLMAELEVSQSNNDRSSKHMSEKEEQLRKLKQRQDELLATEVQLKKHIAKLEKEKEELSQQISIKQARIVDLEITVDRSAVELKEERDATASKISKFTDDIGRLSAQKELVEKSLHDTKNELKIAERKAAGVIKDLQKQILKERKYQEQIPERGRSIDNLAAEETVRSRSSSVQKAKSPKEKDAVGIPKVEKLTGELVQLAKENESLNKRARHAEEEIKSLHERLNKLTEDVDHKSKTIQQYMLRDYAEKLQPDNNEPHHNKSVNMSILSSGSAMSKMDPILLAQVNMKMQKLLEELTSKMMGLEEENRSLKSAKQLST